MYAAASHDVDHASPAAVSQPATVKPPAQPPAHQAAAAAQRHALDLTIPGRRTPTSCLVDTATDGRGNLVVLMVEDRDNHGASVTNVAEHLPAALRHQLAIPADRRFRVWECYDLSSGYSWRDTHLDEIHITPTGDPSWTPVMYVNAPGRSIDPCDIPALARFGFLNP